MTSALLALALWMYAGPGPVELTEARRRVAAHQRLLGETEAVVKHNENELSRVRAVRDAAR